jgi:hypothetical protein
MLDPALFRHLWSDKQLILTLLQPTVLVMRVAVGDSHARIVASNQP